MKGYIFLLIFITTLVYLNSFGNDFVWDDLNNIVQNMELDNPLGLREVFLNPSGSQIFYRPIPYLTIWLDWHFWRENPAGYHLTNLIFHLVCVILVFFLCQRLVQSTKVSFLGALIFAIHPVHTEAVTYISGRSDLISGFFIFLSFLLYLNFLDAVNKKGLYLSSALFSFSLALFSKEIALILPLVIIFYNLCFNKRSQGAVLFFLLFAVGYILFRYFFVKMPLMQVNLGNVYHFPAIFLFYLRLLVFPFNLHMQHSLEMSLFISAIILLVIVFIGLRFIPHLLQKPCSLLRGCGRKQILSAEFNTLQEGAGFIRDKYLRFGITWFAFWLMPFLGFLKFNSDMAEHWLYISSFGFFLITANLIGNRFVYSSIILFLCCLTIQRNIVWRDDISIYKDTLRYNPQDIRLHYNLGNAYLRKGLSGEAEREYLICLKEKLDYAYALNNLKLISNYVFADEVEHFDHNIMERYLINMYEMVLWIMLV